MAHNQKSLPSLQEEVEIMLSNVNNQNKSRISNLPSPKGNDAPREWGISRREQSICVIRKTSNYSTCSGKKRRQQKQQPGISLRQSNGLVYPKENPNPQNLSNPSF